MLFLIDYENVNGSGMRGCEYLSEEDRVVIFYSGSANHIEKRYIDQIEDAKCEFEAIKLLKSRKNALDFYIASHLGRIYGEGYQGSVAIISKDSGFSSVKDYWKNYADGYSVFLSPSIETAIISAEGKGDRGKLLQKMKAMSDISVFFAKHQRRLKLHMTLSDIFENTKYQTNIETIEEIIDAGDRGRILYLRCLKQFGREDGLEIYRKLKIMQEQLAFSSCSEGN